MNQLLSQQAALNVLAQQQALAGALANPGAAAQSNQAQILLAAQLAQLQAAQLSQLGWPLQQPINPAADLTSIYANQLGLNMGLAQLAQLSVRLTILTTLKTVSPFT